MRIVSYLALLVLFSGPAFAQDYTGKKILWIDAYHQGYGWSDGIEEGVRSAVEGTGAELKVHRMDTKRNTSEEFIINAADEAKAVIEEYGPDIVIASDDNASKHLVVKYYKDADLPIVFNGVNWSVEEYGYPFSNVTGMIEVNAADELVDILLSMTDGDRIGYLTSDVITEKKDIDNTRKVFDFEFEHKLVKTMDEWKEAFKEFQNKYDVVVLQNNAGINDWDEDEAARFAEAETKVPTGSFYDWMAPYSLVVYGKVAQEQGEYAVKTAFEILDGKKPGDIPLVKNERGQIFINAKIAESAQIEVPAELIEAADTIIE